MQFRGYGIIRNEQSGMFFSSIPFTFVYRRGHRSIQNDTKDHHMFSLSHKSESSRVLKEIVSVSQSNQSPLFVAVVANQMKKSREKDQQKKKILLKMDSIVRGSDDEHYHWLTPIDFEIDNYSPNENRYTLMGMVIKGQEFYLRRRFFLYILSVLTYIICAIIICIRINWCVFGC